MVQTARPKTIRAAIERTEEHVRQVRKGRIRELSGNGAVGSGYIVKKQYLVQEAARLDALRAHL
jgi:hypothetical protein